MKTFPWRIYQFHRVPKETHEFYFFFSCFYSLTADWFGYPKSIWASPLGTKRPLYALAGTSPDHYLIVIITIILEVIIDIITVILEVIITIKIHHLPRTSAGQALWWVTSNLTRLPLIPATSLQSKYWHLHFAGENMGSGIFNDLPRVT